MKLFYKKLGEGFPIIVLHGLFGSSDNWVSMAKRFSDKYALYLLDLRNHGQSPHSNTHDYPSMVEDLVAFVQEEKLDKAILLGHSMGGKVAMKFAVQNPTKVEKLVVVDMAPKVYKSKSKYIIEALMSLDLSQISSRDQADKLLADKIKNRAIRLFTLKNLYRNDDLSFSWRLNLESLNNNLEKIGGAFGTEEIFDKETLFLQGEHSNYILDEDYELIKRIFPKSSIEKIPNAGHWIHTEQPELTFEKINNFFSQ